MGTKYYCDACKKETCNQRDLEAITREKRNKDLGMWKFDLCNACAGKIFKPVKEFITTIVVEIEEGK